MTSNLYIGLMSGTSADGIDAVLVDLSRPIPTVLEHAYLPYEPTMRQAIIALMEPTDNEILRMGSLDRELGILFASTVNALLKKANCNANDVCAIGSHGQTIRHYPYEPLPFTLQIGDPNLIASLTGITTIADFRRKDMALNGQGAPLVPRFHQAVFQTNAQNRIIVNIGGIANITLLPADTSLPITGFDTGPGNALLDAWCMLHLGKTYDDKGHWASTGTISEALLATCLSDPYFHLAPPKSAGREYFQLTWLQQQINQHNVALLAEDVAATLSELTAISIIKAITDTGMTNGEIILCGGGVHNHYLFSRMRAHCGTSFKLLTSDAFGIHPNLVEAMAFAWLAKQTLSKQPGNLPSVTGAEKAAILGGIYSYS